LGFENESLQKSETSMREGSGKMLAKSPACAAMPLLKARKTKGRIFE